jgi:cell division transport system permease protein
MLRNIPFYIKEAFLSTKKNGIISFATVISLTATLIIVGMFLLISFNISIFLNNMESQLLAIAYLQDGLSEEEIDTLVQDVSELQGVQEIRYISKEEAFQNLKEDLSEHEEILAGIQENPLPASIEIIVTKPQYLEEITFQIEQYNGIEEVNYGGQLTKNLLLVFDFVRKTGIAIISLLIFIAILIMVSVIKIGVHSRQQEIEIMSLVGATSWFIRWPFIIEGFLKGLLSSIIAVIVLVRGYHYYINQLRMILPFIDIAPDNIVLIRMTVFIITLGLFIGIFGSIISLRRIRYEEL